jgi:hypothetical protein
MIGQSNSSSLLRQPCDPYTFDLNHFESILTANSKRLFVKDDELQIKLMEIGSTGT